MSSYIEKNKRTKATIQQGFLDILEQKSFESITIQDITKHVHMNRGTFYLHYLDKYDLLEQMEQNLFEQFGHYIDELQQYDAQTNFETAQEKLAANLFGFIAMHAPMLKIFLSEHGRAGFHLRLRDAFSMHVRENIEQNTALLMSLKAPIDYFMAFITSAFLGLIEQWLQKDLDKTPEEMTALYIDIIRFIQGRR